MYYYILQFIEYIYMYNVLKSRYKVLLFYDYNEKLKYYSNFFFQLIRNFRF